MIEMVRGMPRPAGEMVGMGQPNLLHINFVGLGTRAGSDCNGMRPQSVEVQEMFPGSDYIIHTWDEDGWFLSMAVSHCAEIATLVETGNTYGPYTHVVVRGHSFGGNFAVLFLNWLKEYRTNLKVKLAVLLDPVPNVLQPTSWTIPMDLVGTAVQFTQKNGGFFWFPPGPLGTPVTDVALTGRLISFDLTHVKSPTLFHSTLVGDSRVWNIQLSMFKAMVVVENPVASQPTSSLERTLQSEIAIDTRPLGERDLHQKKTGRKRSTIVAVKVSPPLVGALPVKNVTCGVLLHAGVTVWGALKQQPFNRTMIAQGQVGDCYWLAGTLSFGLFDPNFLDDIIIPVKLADGTNGAIVQLVWLGSIVQILMTLEVSTSYNKANDDDIRMELLEKAYAFLRSGVEAPDYLKLNWGGAGEAYAAFGGIWSSVPSTVSSIETAMAGGKGCVIITTAFAKTLAASHAYCVLGTQVINGVKKLILINPWYGTLDVVVDDTILSGPDTYRNQGVGKFQTPRVLLKPAPAIVLPGDANRNGHVDLTDLTILSRNWGKVVPVGTDGWAMGDFNGDGKVDMIDLSILASNWQKGT